MSSTSHCVRRWVFCPACKTGRWSGPRSRITPSLCSGHASWDLVLAFGAMRRCQAVIFRGAGGPEVVELGDFSVPPPGPGEVLVEVAAAGLNRADLLQRMGRYPAPPGVPRNVPGLELSGRVLDLGTSVTEWKRDDRVMALTAGGAMAGLAVVPASQLMPWPEGFSAAEAAAIPEAFVTAFDALVTQASLERGEAVLIHAVGSGVGTAAVQVASSLSTRVIGTSRTKAKIERLLGLGLDSGIVPEEGKFSEEVLEVTGGQGVDVVLDLVGASYAEETLACLAPCARWIVVGLLGGARAKINLATLLSRRATIRGSILRSRSRQEKGRVIAAFRDAMLPGFAEGRLDPVVAEVLPIAKIREAHRLMAKGGLVGKIVLAF